MKNTLSDLNNYLFEELERINDESLKPDELETEITRSKAITNIASNIINNANVQLNAMKHMDEYGYGNESHRKAIPSVLEVSE